ncbi:MAG: exodeoxyribonuclease VII small subunit [Azospirillaceae bacterium]
MAGTGSDDGGTAIPEDVAAMTFEQALAELEGLVRKLESGEIELDESIAAYERGARLKAHCERKLAEAQQKVDTIAKTPDGGVTLQEGGSET